MNTEALSQAQSAGIELGPQLEQAIADNTEVVQSTIQNPALKEPVAVPKDNQENPADQPNAEDREDLSWLDIPEDLGVEEVKEPLQLPDTPEAKKFAEDFKQYLGFDVNELREGIQSFKSIQEEIQTYRAQKAADAQLKTLQQEWGVQGEAFDTRMKQVVERFNKYSPEMKAKLDGLEGAKLIWAKIEQEKAAKARPDVPQFERSRAVGVSGGGEKVMFSKADILAMDEKTYAANADRIAYAYANGLVQK